jgi:hypothetical protein
METLNALFRKVDVASLLQPMGVRQIKHLSIFVRIRSHHIHFTGGL